MRFIIIKRNFLDVEMLINVIKNLLGKNIKVMINDNSVIIIHEYPNNDDIKKMLISLSSDLMINLVSYVSSDIYTNKGEKELEVISPIIDSNDIDYGIYTLKDLLVKKINIPNKRELLNYILEATGIDEVFINDFCNNDLNVSKASKSMYIHRNTMIYKLDKLKEASGFDLRCFNDAYILYKLIKN